MSMSVGGVPVKQQFVHTGRNERQRKKQVPEM
jgi:hypothetical protein